MKGTKRKNYKMSIFSNFQIRHNKIYDNVYTIQVQLQLTINHNLKQTKQKYSSFGSSLSSF